LYSDSTSGWVPATQQATSQRCDVSLRQPMPQPMGVCQLVSLPWPIPHPLPAKSVLIAAAEVKQNDAAHSVTTY
jgi:hypothetical protein